MAEIRGIVTKLNGERAEVKVDKSKSSAASIPRYLDCWNPINAKAGQNVGVEYQALEKRKAQLIIYGLPVLGVIAGATFGNSLALFFHMDKVKFILGGVLLWLLIAVNYVRIFRRDAVRSGLQPVIVDIEVPKMVIDTGAAKEASGDAAEGKDVRE